MELRHKPVPWNGTRYLTIASILLLSLRGVNNIQPTRQYHKAFYLSIPGAVVEHEDAGRFVSIRMGDVNLVRLGRSGFHIEIGTSDLDALGEHLDTAGIHENGPQPQQWGERGLVRPGLAADGQKSPQLQAPAFQAWGI